MKKMSRQQKHRDQLAKTIEKDIIEALEKNDTAEIARHFSDLLDDYSHKTVALVLRKKISTLQQEVLLDLAAVLANLASKKFLRCIREFNISNTDDNSMLFLLRLSLNGRPETCCVTDELLSKTLTREVLETIANIRTGNPATKFKPLLSMHPSLLPAIAHYLGEKLACVNRVERDKLVKILGVFGKKSQSVIPYLLSSLGDKSSHVCTSAALALSSLGPLSVPHLQKAASSKNSRIRIAALWAMGRMQNEQALLSCIIKGLSDEQEKVRKSAVAALLNLGEPAVSELLNVLEPDSDVEMIVAAIEFLRELAKDSQETISCILSMASHAEPRVRIAVLKAFRKIKTPQSIPVILKGLEDPKDAVKLAAVKVVERSSYQMEPAVEPLLTILKSQDSDLRKAATKALGKTGKGDDVLDALIKMCRDDEPAVRVAAIKAIGAWKSKASVILPELIAQLKNGDLFTMPAVLESIACMGTLAKENIADVLRLVSWEDPLLTSQAILTLGALGENAIAPLMRLIENAPAQFRKHICNALAQIGDKAIAPLIEGLREGSELQRKMAAQALGQMGKMAVAFLVEVLQHQDFWVRKATSKALLEIGSPCVIPLFEVIRKNGAPARESAYYILKRLKGKALPYLVCVIKDPHPQLSQFALKMFEKIGPEYADAIPGLISVLNSARRSLIRQAAVWSLSKIGENTKLVMEALSKAAQDPDPEVRKASQKAVIELRAGRGAEEE